MTEYDANVARDIGALQADMRTVKHDVAQVSTKLDGLSSQLNKLGNKQERSLGFVAGAAFILTGAGGLLLLLAKALFGVHP